MKCRANYGLCVVLMAAFVVSLPASLAKPAAIYPPQSSDSSRTCCASNGWQSSKRALSQHARLDVGKHPPNKPRSTSQSSSNAGTSPRYKDRTDSQSLSRNQTLERNKVADSDASVRRLADVVQEERGRSQKPALQRPADSVPQQESSPAQGSGRQGSSRETEQANAAAASSSDDVVRLESTLVNIPLLVSDRAGRYIPRMTKRDFMVYEDGVEQEIATFTNEEVAFNVVLLLDMSPSVHGSVEAIQDACIAFVDQMRPQDRVMVVSFDRRIKYLTDLTNDRRQLEYAIRSTYTGSGTSVHDAVYDTVGRKLGNVEGRKALILFSDGEDTTSSSASYEDTIEMVSESDVLVYGLRFPAEHGGYLRIDPSPRYRWPQIPGLQIPLPMPAPRRPRGPFSTSNSQPSANQTATAATGQGPRRRGDFIADVATAGGGPVYDAQNVGDFSRLANQIAEELRNIYMISYYPKNKLSTGGYRAVRVRVKGNDNLAVRHRKGYNAGSVSRVNIIH